MKLRVGACALMLVLAGCSGESPESGMAGMRGVAASKPTGTLPTSLPLARAIGASIANLPDRGALLSFPNKSTPAMLEGYAAAKVLVEGLRRASPGATREKLKTALETFRRFDIGGLEVTFTPTDHSGLDYADLSIVGEDGAFRR